MRSTRSTIALVMLVVAGGGAPAMAQGVLGRLESGIRQANGQPTPTTVVPAAPRVYLGAMALDENGRGARITSVGRGGPADRAGLRAQDLAVAAGGRRVRFVRDLMTILGNMNPGDRVAVEVVRGTRPLRVEVVLEAPPGVARPEPQIPEPPPTGLGAGRTETIPPPPGELASPPSGDRTVPPPLEGPSLIVPSQPVAPNSPQVQIEELRRRVEQLERRVQELERALAESRKK